MINNELIIQQFEPPVVTSVEEMTPEYFMNHYKEFLSRYISKGRPEQETMNTYCYQIDIFLKWCLTNKINPMTAGDFQIRSYREYLFLKNYSNNTVREKLAAIKAFYLTAVKMGFKKLNPCSDIDAPISGTNDMLYKYYDIEQLKKLSEVFSNEPDSFVRARNVLILHLMAVEGLRNVEVHRMNIEDINWESCAIMVRGKGQVGRLDPIYPSDDTMNALSVYIDVMPETKCIKKDGVLTPLILSASNLNQYGRISKPGLRDILNRGLKAAGLKHEGLSCHIMRHSCGTNLYRATKDLRIVQETLRQRDPRTTAKYAHVQERLANRPTGLLKIT